MDCFASDLFETLNNYVPTRFYQNWPSFIESVTETSGLIFTETWCTSVQHAAFAPYYVCLYFQPDAMFTFEDHMAQGQQAIKEILTVRIVTFATLY